MMPERKEIRKRARHALRTHYWIFVAACLLAAAVINLKKCNELSEHMKAIGVQN